MLFAKFANAVVADGDPIVRPPGTHALDLEVELGVVIGERASRVARADAMEHVAGYVVVNDVTARDWQGSKQALGQGERGDGQWLRAKGSDTFLPDRARLRDDGRDPRSVRPAPAQLADPRQRRGRRGARSRCRTGRPRTWSSTSRRSSPTSARTHHARPRRPPDHREPHRASGSSAIRRCSSSRATGPL